MLHLIFKISCYLLFLVSLSMTWAKGNGYEFVLNTYKNYNSKEILEKDTLELCQKSYPVCSEDSKNGDICAIFLTEVKPTQIYIGKKYSEWFYKKRTLSNFNFQQNLCNNPFPLLVGNKKTSKGFYLLDGHHRLNEAREYVVMQKPAKFTVLMKVMKNLNHEPIEEEFWPWMQKNNFSFLPDKLGKNASKYLPKNMFQLKNDPYRSLTGFLKERNLCFAKNNVYFMEFYWGEYLKKKSKELKGIYTDKANLEQYINRIMETNVCHKDEASGLPGFIEKKNITMMNISQY